MKKIKLGGTDLYVSQIGMGVLTMAKSQLNLNKQIGSQLIRYAIGKGINFFDTAQYYDAYEYLREAIHDQENIVICSKCLDHGYYQMKYAVEEALRKLDRNVIEIFMMHELRPNEDRSGAWEYLLEAKKQGIVKAIGVSTHHVDMAEFALSLEGIDVLFPLINVQSMGIRNGESYGTKEEMEKVIKKAHDKNIGVFIMKIFGGGNLTKNYSESFNYALKIKGVHSLMIGMGNKEEIDNAIDFFNGNTEENFQPDVTRKRIHIEEGNCEGCGACIARCPNKALSFGNDGLAQVDDSICLTCGYCAPVCPTRAIILW